MKKKLLVVLFMLFGLAPLAFAQTSPLSHVAGVYSSESYSKWSDRIYAGPVSAASPASFQMTSPTVTTRDGHTFVPFFVNEIVTIGSGSNAENVTLTAVSGCYPNAPQGNCVISGNTSNSHGQGDQVVSGTGGIGEAINDASSQGGGMVYWEKDCGPVTLSTTGLTTTITTCTVPESFTAMGGSIYVTTTAAGPSTYHLGIASSTQAFITSCTSLTAGQNCSQFVNAPTRVATGVYTTFTSVLITAVTSDFSSGVMHPKVWGYTQVQSSY